MTSVNLDTARFRHLLTIRNSLFTTFTTHTSLEPMRAEIEHLVDEAKQSIALLRRHL